MRATSFTTLVGALDSFDASGYRDVFRADGRGLYASHEGRVFAPSELQVDRRARVEGDSNPDEESLVFALRDPKTNLKGTYTVVFGPNMDPLDVETIQLLKCDRLPDRTT